MAALHGWHCIAALGRRRAYMLADHLRQEQKLRLARNMLRTWHQASEVATAQTSFIIQSLPVRDKGMMTNILRGWQARCQMRRRVNAFR